MRYWNCWRDVHPGGSVASVAPDRAQGLAVQVASPGGVARPIAVMAITTGEEGNMRPIRRTAMVVTLLVGLGAAALLAGSQLGGTQPGQPNFETGSLPVTVENAPAVLVTNEPVVRAQQMGDWTVRLSDEQSRNRTVTLSDAQVARLTMPGFVEAGVTYTFVWPDGSTEAHLVVALANGGWVQVEGERGSLKWVNASAARSIESAGAIQ